MQYRTSNQRFGGNPVVFLFCGNKNRLAPKIMVEFGSFNDLNKYMKLPFDMCFYKKNKKYLRNFKKMLDKIIKICYVL